MKYLLSFFSLGLLFLSTFVQAQSHLSLRFRPELSSAQLFQPAYIGKNKLVKFDLGLDGFYELASNSLSRQNIFLSDVSLDEELKDRILSDLDSDNRLRLGAGAMAQVGFRLGNCPLAVSYGIHQQAWGQVNQPTTLGLLLYGNKHYAGQRLVEDQAQAQLLSYQEFGLGTGIHRGDLHLGLRAKFLLGGSSTFIDELSFELETDSLGTELDAMGNYNIFLGQEPGMGAALDLGLVYNIGERISVQASFENLGFINFQGEELSKNFDINYQGEEVESLDDLLSGGNFSSVDSLLEEVLPDTAQGSLLRTLPGRYHLGISYKLGSHHSFQLSLLGSNRIEGGGRPNPFVNLGYQYRLGSQNVFVGLNVFAGGLEGFGFGGMISGDFLFVNKHVQAYVQAPNLWGWIRPEEAAGNLLSAGLGFRLEYLELPSSRSRNEPFKD